MSVVEFIGFVISLVMMIFLVGKRFWEESQRRKNPEAYAEKERLREKTLQDFLKAHEIHFEEEELEDAPPAPPVLPMKQPPSAPKPLPKKSSNVEWTPLRSSLEPQSASFSKKHERRSIKDPYENHQREEVLRSEFHKGEAQAYEIKKVYRPSTALKAIDQLPTLKNMVIIREILDRPASMRKSPWDEIIL